MNWEQVRDQWRQLPGRAKSRWSQLTNDGVGMRDKLIGWLRARLEDRFEVRPAERALAYVTDARRSGGRSE